MASSRVLSKVREVVKTTITAGVSVFLFQEYIGGFVLCTGPSMEPTIYTSDIIMTDHISPRLGNISKGDIVIARNPVNYQCICKRVVGLSGEHVFYKGKIIKIPEKSYWLEGDNKGNSTDSRNYGNNSKVNDPSRVEKGVPMIIKNNPVGYQGPVPGDLIRRRCFCKVWPTIHLNFQYNFPRRSVAGSSANFSSKENN